MHLTLVYTARKVFATQFLISLDFRVSFFPDSGDNCNKNKVACEVFGCLMACD